jgi:membrane protease subunit HflC
MKKLLAILGVAAIVVVLNSIFIIEQRQQALVLQFGEPQRAIQEAGLYFKIPMIQDVTIYDKRILDYSASDNEVIDADNKLFVVNAFVKYKINDPLTFYQRVKTIPIARQRLNTFLDSSLREVVGKERLKDLLTTKRTEIMTSITKNVREKSTNIGVDIVDVRITRADLPPENMERTYGRMRAEREREAKDFRARGAEEAQRIRSEAEKDRTVLIAEAEKQSQIVRGEGDSKAIATFAEAFERDPEFYGFYRSMEAYRNTLGKDDTSMLLSPDSEFLQYFDTSNGN